MAGQQVIAAKIPGNNYEIHREFENAMIEALSPFEGLAYLFTLDPSAGGPYPVSALVEVAIENAKTRLNAVWEKHMGRRP